MHGNEYHGIYRGEIVDNNDPKKLGRLKVKVTQVLGENVTDWAWPISGMPGYSRMPYGIFSSMVDQSISGTTVINMGIVEDTTNIKMVGGTKMQVEDGGDYFLQFSAQFAKNTSSEGQADIWIRKNGVDIPRTRSRVTLQGNPNEALVTVNYILDLDVNDYVQIVAAPVAGATGIHLSALTNNPGIIASLNLIGKYKPKAKTPVWVMFEGGDPNFPLWIGTF